MSNTEAQPQEVVCEETVALRPRLVTSREVPLGGPRHMLVKRTLPSRGMTLIGAWCFADHYGPANVGDTGGMRVAGHPHTGLQTVSWLFEGEIEHRDTAGYHAMVRPGEVNIMTAGSGIAHSEYSTPSTTTLHGVQLWVALPEESRFIDRHFEYHVTEAITYQGGIARILVGNFSGHSSPVKAYTELLGVELSFTEPGIIEIEVDERFEHGILVDTGGAISDGIVAEQSELIFFPTGRRLIKLEIQEKTRVMLLGGVPFGEKLVMWWNFIGRDHDEIIRYRERWQSERSDDQPGASEDNQFGEFPNEWRSTLPAPELPNVRLRPRE